jgi:thiol-disulfide isomerase/thioredoxin
MAVNKLTDADFGGTLSENPKVVVKFFADWCGSCRLIAPKFTRLSDRYPDVRFVEVNAEENPETRKLAGVTNLPFFATFQGGNLVKGDATSKIESVEAMIQALA